MKTLIEDIKTSVVATLVLAVICCGVYPVVVWGLSQAIFSKRANGSLLQNQAGQVMGSELLGQNFSGAQYFSPRPSAAGAAGYDAAGSSGSNLGPTSQKLIAAVQQRVADYRKTNNLPDVQPVPADAVTASGSGLDPHISVKNAQLQLPRVAQERGLTLAQVAALVQKNTDGADWGLLGEPGVNVLKLNLALDQVPVQP